MYIDEVHRFIPDLAHAQPLGAHNLYGGDYLSAAYNLYRAEYLSASTGVGWGDVCKGRRR